MANIRSFKDLIAWQKAMDLVEEAYRISAAFPSDERFGVTSQFRRAAVSIPSNIAEGHGRSTRADFVRFLDIALGSANEAETHLLIAERLKFVSPQKTEAMSQQIAEVQKILKGLLRKVAGSDTETVRH